MSFTVLENEKLKEKYYLINHKSGLRVYVYPKKMSTSYAAFATKFGSVDNKFLCDGKETDLPDGIAHFLEHKMFENEDGSDTFELYAKTGANANAYTTSDRTVYLFSAADNVAQSLEILLGFVTHPYFTDETVAKEQGIIGQEIRMYDDNPNWQLYFGMLSGLYVNNPVRIDTAGTVETIATITPEKLFDAYNAFYNLSNMALCVCGDIDCEQVEEVCDRVLKYVKAPEAERIYPSEPDGVYKEFVTKKMQVSMPMFFVGIKDNECPMSGRELMKKRAEYCILLDLMFDKSTDFYNELYESGLVDSSFSYEYEGHETFAISEISGCSENPDQVYKKIRDHIALCKKNGFSKEDFERIKRANYAHSIGVFNSTEDIANELISCVFEDADMLDFPQIVADVTFEDINNRLKTAFADNAFTLSTVYPQD